jgi:hypothetical protein
VRAVALDIYRSVTAPDGVPEDVARTLHAGDRLAAAGGAAFALSLVAVLGLLGTVIPVLLLVVTAALGAWLAGLVAGVEVAVITEPVVFGTFGAVYALYVVYSVSRFAHSVRVCLHSGVSSPVVAP